MQQFPSDSGTLVGRLQCPRCCRAFIRSEHLRRHLRNHEVSKRFACRVCNKQFARSDILAKHRAAHENKAQPDLSRDDGLLPRKSRACHACAKARERCTKDIPCLRCSRRSLDCVYPNTKERCLESKQSRQVRTAVSNSANATEITATYDGHGTNDNGLHSSELVLTPPDTTAEHDLVASVFSGELAESVQPWSLNSELALQDDDASNALSINWLPFDQLIDPYLATIVGETMHFPLYDDAGWPASQDQNTSLPNAVNAAPNVPVWDTDSLYQPAAAPSASNDAKAAAANSRSDSVLSPSITISTPSTTAPEDLYATSSGGGRNACSTRAQRDAIFRQTEQNEMDSSTTRDATVNDLMAFPLIAEVHTPDLQPYSTVITISNTTYEHILSQFEDLCLQKQSHMPCFESSYFPPLSVMSLFVQLYVKYFDPILPFIHLTTLDTNNSWLLATALAAIGSHYCQSRELTACSVPLHEFCRRSLTRESDRAGGVLSDLSSLQALLLNQVGLSYSGSTKLQLGAHGNWGSILSVIDLQCRRCLSRLDGDADSIDYSWQRWIHAESWRRLYFATRLLHGMATHHFNLRVDAGRESREFDVPHDKLWAAHAEEEWSSLHAKAEANPSLGVATSNLFRNKTIQPEIGEFSQCVLLHELYYEIANVVIYNSRDLATWIPAAKAADATDVADTARNTSSTLDEPTLTVLGHSVKYSTTVSDWRNAALDCIDVLHWTANAKIASLAGAEHPMVLHLHYSRVVLLVPRVALMSIAESALSTAKANEAGNTPSGQSQKVVEDAERQIREWAQRDSSKARLAAIHSGCVFWHIRRYSRAAFYEPVSVFYATLALWAFGFYTPKHTSSANDPNQRHQTRDDGDITSSANAEIDRTSRGSSPESPSSQHLRLDDRDPTFIRLDRPNDDEMVQLFVSSGQPSKMSALISGVGDICAPKGPALVLKEGRDMLKALTRNWSVGSYYVDLLQALEHVTRSRRT